MIFFKNNFGYYKTPTSCLVLFFSTVRPTDGSVKCSLPFKVSESKELVEWENWAKIQLMSAGSDLLGKFSNLQVLCFVSFACTYKLCLCLSL